MRAFVTIISYCAFMLLVMPTSKLTINETPILLVLGSMVLAWKKPWKKPWEKECSPNRLSTVLWVIFLLYLGIRFCIRWSKRYMFLFVSSILPMSDKLYHAVIVVCAVCGAVCSFYFCTGAGCQIKAYISEKTHLRKRDLWCCLTASAATVMLAQVMINIDIWSMGHFKFLCGVLLVAAVIVILYCLCGRIILSIALGSGLFMLISTINVYVYSFRLRLFVPLDLFSAGTALRVVDNYNLLSPLPAVLFGWGIWFAVLLYIASHRSKEENTVPARSRAALAACCVFGITLLFAYTAQLPIKHWRAQGATVNGYFLDYFSKIRDIYVSAPDGYLPEEIDVLSEEYSRLPDSSGKEEKPPHVIVIMDESFSDLNAIGEIRTNTEVMPFISNMHENTVSGYALTSVYGGNTANSEYEFLTGNSMAWLPPNTVPYQQYIDSPTYSMVSYLKSSYDYRCVAMHPFYSAGWNRPEVYNHLGFDETYFLEDFPQKQHVRSYVSDLEMFQVIVDCYEKNKENPLFLFGVTMQNHGGYTYTGDDFTQSVSLVGYQNDYPAVEQYLSLLHETDKAVEYLITYFEHVDDQVVIVFFGDHQPKIDSPFYEEVSGSNSSSLGDQQKKYIVPFFIWANYDIPEKHVECTSLNYLSSYVYDTAGIPLPPYNLFLRDLEKVTPSINVQGFYSLDSDSYIPFSMASESEQTWLRKYEYLQYNNLFDQNSQNRHFFPTPE